MFSSFQSINQLAKQRSPSSSLVRPLYFSCGAPLILREKIRNAFGRSLVVSSNAPAGDLTGLDQLARGWRRDADLCGGLRRRYFGFAFFSISGHRKYLHTAGRIITRCAYNLLCFLVGRWKDGEAWGFTQNRDSAYNRKSLRLSRGQSTCQSCQTRQTQKLNGRVNLCRMARPSAFRFLYLSSTHSQATMIHSVWEDIRRKSL